MTRRTSKRKTTVRNVSKLQNAVHSQVNPFSKGANGSKQYDENTSMTIPSQQKTLFTMTTDANGACQALITALPVQSHRIATTIVADAVTVDGSWVQCPNYSSISSYTGFRVVSYGVRIITICPADTAAGILRISTVNGATVLPAFSDIGHETKHMGLSGGKDFTWIGAGRGSASHDFLAMPTTVVDFGGTGEIISPFTMLDIMVSGGPASTTIFAVEVVVNYEFLPAENLASSSHATKAYPSSAAIREHVANYHAIANHIFEGVEQAGGFAAGAAAISRAPSIWRSISSYFSSAVPAIENAAVELAPAIL